MSNMSSQAPSSESTISPAKPKSHNPVDLYQNFFQSPNARQAGEQYKYRTLLPSFPKINLGPAPEFDVTDVGLGAKMRWTEGALARREGVKIVEITPAIGTEITGVSLNTLDEEERAELAVMLAERGIVVFRNQADVDIDQQTSFVSHFGPLHLHASSGVPNRGDLPHVHVVYQDSTKKAPPSAFSKLELWHADVSYELQPPGLSSFKVLTNPPSGGDTLFASAYAAYDTLSPSLRLYVESLSALHSGLAQGGKDHLRHQRRPPIETVHPVVRVHPVTGWKSIFVDPASTRYIVGVPKGESEMILSYLFGLVATGTEFQARIKWNENDVGIWDNRCVLHAGSFDFWPHTRHAVRVMAVAEKPLSVEAAKASGIKVASRETEEHRRRGWDLIQTVN